MCSIGPPTINSSFGVSLRLLLFVAQGQVTFLYEVSYRPKVLKRVFRTCFFLIHAGYSEKVILTSNAR